MKRYHLPAKEHHTLKKEEKRNWGRFLDNHYDPGMHK